MKTQTLQNDLTQGGVLRQLLRFSLPLMATSLLQSMYSIVDTVVAGQVIGSRGLSAIANASLILTLLTQAAIGLTSGGGALLGQYFGKKDERSLQKTAGTLFTFCLGLGLFFSILIFVLAEPLMTMMNTPAHRDACHYIRICAPGILVTYGYNALAAEIRAKGNSRQPLYFIILATVINIGLDLWFVAGLGWGVAGTAWATLAAQTATFLCALGFVRHHREFYGFTLENLNMEWKRLGKLLKVGVPSALQMVLSGISWLAVMYFINRYDMNVSAAAGTANKIRETLLMLISAMAAGAATMAAQNLGARQLERAKQVIHVTLGVNLLLAVVIIGVEQLAAEHLAAIFSSEETVVYYAARHLRLESISFLFFAAYMSYNAIAVAAGHTVFIMANTFICIVMRVVLVIVMERAMGLDGIYWACGIAPAVSVPVGMLYMRSGVWKRSDLVHS